MKSAALTLSLLLSASLPLASTYTCDFSSGTDIDGSGLYSTDDGRDIVTKRAIVPNTPRASALSARSISKLFLARYHQRSSPSSADVLARRQSDSIDCSQDEDCYSEPSVGYLLCVNADTGEFSDNTGSHGNYDTGVVTDAYGIVVTVPGVSAGASTATGLGGLGGGTGLPSDFPTTATDSGLGPGQTGLGGAGQSSLGADGSGDVGSSSVQTGGEESTGGAVTGTSGVNAAGTPSVSMGSGPNGQPTGKVAGGGAAGQAGVDVAAAVGAFGLMAAML